MTTTPRGRQTPAAVDLTRIKTGQTNVAWFSDFEFRIKCSVIPGRHRTSAVADVRIVSADLG